ncbi:MAG: translocation/assembly module TamB domain-containing protein [Alphaproteobacteria bacterium]
MAAAPRPRPARPGFAAAALAFGLLQTGWGQRAGIGFANDALAASGLRLEIDRIDGLVPFDMTIPHFRLDDAEGTAIAADDLHVAIAASDLLAGTVALRDVSAARIAIVRPPVTPPAPDTPAAALAWPSLPADIAVDRIAVARLELGAALAGEPLMLSVDGSFALAANAGTATLEVHRLDGPPADVTLTARVDAAGKALTLDLVAEEPEGSLVPRLAGWDYDGPWRLTVAGDGPLDDWQGRLLLTAGTETLADLAVAGRLDPDAPRLAATGRLALPAAAMPPELGPLPLAIDLTGGLADDRIALAGSVTGREAELTLDLTATLAAPIALDGQVALASRDLGATLAGLDLPLAGAATVSVDVAGPLDDLAATVGVEASALDAFGWQARRLTASVDAAGSPLDGTGSARLSLQADGPAATDLDLAAYRVDALALDATVRANGNALAVEDIALTAGPTRLAGSVDLGLADGTIGFALDVEAPAAVALAQAGFAEAAGSLAAHLAGAFDTTAGIGWLETVASGEGFAFGSALLDGLAGPTPTVEAAAQIDVARGLQGLDAAIGLAVADVVLSGDLPFGEDAGAAPLGFTVAIRDLATLAGPLAMASEDLGGALTLSGSLGDALSAAPRATVDIAGEAVRIAGQAVGTIATTLAVAPDDDGRLLLVLDGSSDGVYGPVATRADGTLDLAAGTLALSGLDVAALGARVRGDVAVDLASGTLAGRLDVAVAALGGMAGLTGVPLAGSADARVTLTAADGRQDATVGLRGSGLTLADGATVGGLDATIALTDLLGTPSLRGTVEASGIVADAVSLDTLRLTAAGTLEALDLTVAAAGTTAAAGDPQPLSLETDLRLTLTGGDTALRIATLEAAVADERIALNRPADVRLTGGGVAVRGLDAAVFGGRIAGDVALAPGAVDADIEATGIALDRAAALGGDSGVAAQLETLSVRLSGSAAAPDGTVALTVGGVALDGGGAVAEALADARLLVAVALRGGMADVDASLTNVAAEAVTFRLNNAMRLSLAPFAADFSHGQPLDGSVTAHAALNEIAPLLAPSGDILLTGDADIDLGIGGVGGAPVLTGSGTIANATAEVAEIGLVLTRLNAEVAGDGDRLTLRSLSAVDPAGGSMTATGWADFGAGEAAMQFDLALNQLKVMGTDYADVSVSGPLSLAGPILAPAVSGDIVVRPAEIRFAGLRGASYVEVDAIDVNGTSQVAPEPLDLTPPIALPLDVSVRVPNALYIRGYGLESEWRGNLDVTGTSAAPRIVGTLNVIRGTMDLAGQAVEISRGIVTFTGASPPNPLVDIEAIADTGDLAVVVTVRGPASTADFELSSVPALPREEILSRLLFGVGRSSLSGTQALQAGRALALLSGGEGDLGIVNTLRNITGITGLTIEGDTDAEGNPVGAVGGYLSEDVYLEVSRGSAVGSGAAEISVEVLDGIDVTSGLTETGDSRVGINFEWDY